MKVGLQTIEKKIPPKSLRQLEKAQKHKNDLRLEKT
jgi:hypothetical protein